LSDFAHVNAKYAENGLVTVSLGPSFVRDVVVDAGTAFNIGTNYNSASPEKVSLVLDPYGKNQPLTAVTSGKLAGMLSFREQVLGSSRDALDTLAHSFVNEVNKIQTSGVDAYGNNGTDLFKFDPKASNAAGGIQLAFDDPMRLAAASQFRIAESATNTGGAQSKITYTPPNFAGPPSVQQGIGNDPRAAVTFTATPGHPYSAVATLPNGLQNINVMMNGAAGQNLQVFTRDGRQIVGTALTSDQLSALVTTDNGFSPGATVSTQYLNQSGANGYKDLSVFYGARADVRMQQQWDMNVPDPTAHPELPPTPLPALLQGGRIPAGLTGTVVANQALTLNGQSLGPLVVAQGQTLQASDISAWINNANVNGVHAMATNHLQITPSQFATGKPLVLNGQSITSGVNSLVDLAAAINGNSACRLAATIDADGNLQITNSKGHEGESIVVSGAIPNALGLANDTYTGSVSIVRAPQLKFTPNQVSASNAITLNGQLIQASSNSVSSLAAAINASSALTNLKAKIDSDGNLLIENAIGHEGEDIQVSGATPNALGLTNGRVSMTANLLDGTDHSIQLGFTSTGKPDDLSKLGLATDAFIQGQANEDLLVFVTGAGTSQISATYTGAPTDAKQALRASPLQIRFDNADHYSIWDTRTNTQVASQAFDAGQLDPGITYQGLQVSFTAPPKAGDVFTMDGNRDGTGNNQNMLDLVDLQKAKVMGGGRTLSEAYVDQVNDMGNVARQATIAQSALKVVNDQAISARDQVSGVSMDQEAADLIRFQQAYQASAKVLQVASEVFDSILQVR
jgi:flagellar hook-associated protein FlgK